jgi:hypothetical protein
MDIVPEVWWLLQSVTCCDAQGRLIVHSEDLDDRGMAEHVRSVNENKSLPSSTHLATRSMPVRAYPNAYDLASCAHIRNWTFVTMHGLCPSSEYKSGNYAHSLLDALAPMFYTLQLLEPILGATAYEFLVVSQFADPPRRHAQRSASNCDVVAAALGFKRPAIHWDDFAMGRRRYCFDTLIMGMDMNLALAGTYQNVAAFDDHNRLRINAYAEFFRLIRVVTAAFVSVPLVSNARISSALAVRGSGKTRRLINEAEVLQVMTRLLGGAPLVVAFERISMRQMVEEMTTIRLLMGLFSTGLMNGLFMSQGGALQRLPLLCLPFTTIVHNTMPRALSHHTLLSSILLTTDAGVVVSIFQNTMLDASQLLMEGGSLALALCGQTTIYWLLDDRLLSFPRRGTDALGLVAASPPRAKTCGCGCGCLWQWLVRTRTCLPAHAVQLVPLRKRVV